MKKLLKNIYFIFPLLLAFPVYADPPSRLGGEGGGLSISTLVNTLLDYLFPIAGLIALIFIIQGGYMWIVSAGDPARVKQAQGTLTWAVIGLIFILIIFSVLRVVLKFMS